MYLDSTPDPLLQPLRRVLSRPRWQNLLLLVLAVQLARTLIQRQLALFLLCSIFSTSCYRRLARVLAPGTPSKVPRAFQRNAEGRTRGERNRAGTVNLRAALLGDCVQSLAQVVDVAG